MLSIRVPAGQILFEQGDKAHCAYLIEEGWVEIYTERGGNRQSLSRIGVGQIFGEMGIIDGARRTATAMVLEDCRLLCISAEQFLALLDQSEPFHTELLKKLVIRFREAQNAWMDGNQLPRLESAEMGPGYAMLARHRDIAQAIERGEIVPYLQPVVDLTTGRWQGFEALARWHDPVEGLRLPQDFMPLAECTGLVQRIDLSIAQQAMDALKNLPGAPPPFLNLNFSAWHFREKRLLTAVTTLLERTGFSAGRLCIELTETQMLDNADQARQLMADLQTQGIRIALDDFGTGYSSLSVLHQMPFQILKIDRGLVAGVLVDGRPRHVLKNLVALAADLAMDVVTEGVEDDASARALAGLGCRMGQGYLYGRPMPLDAAMAAWISRQGT
jgi:EAL domain-containing protein (putative c-di-GMP-specific phosphodiesterase class I)